MLFDGFKALFGSLEWWFLVVLWFFARFYGMFWYFL